MGKLIECSLKKMMLKVQFTATISVILLFKGRFILSPVQQVTERERVNCLLGNIHLIYCT